MVCHQLSGSHGIGQENGFEKFYAAALFSRRVRQGPAAEPKSQDGTVDHPGGHLEIIFVGKRIVGFIDAAGKKPGDKLGLLAIEADGGCLVKFRRLFLFVF